MSNYPPNIHFNLLSQVKEELTTQHNPCSWDLSDELGRGFLSAEEFRRATQLVSLAQMGHQVNDDLARRLRAGAIPTPPPPQMRVPGASSSSLSLLRRANGA